MVNINDVEADLLSSYIAVAFNLSEQKLARLKERLWAFSARIRQPRKDDGTCNSTPFFNRWDTDGRTSHLTVTDPRYASEEECRLIYKTLLASLLEAQGIHKLPSNAVALAEKVLSRPFVPNSLVCVHTGQPISVSDIKRALDYTTQRLGSYEIPVSYRKELSDGGRHHHTNVGWMKPFHVNYKLRMALKSHLVDRGVPTDASNNALEKILVKAYCTDKVTMPPFYSNRDIRWATWPASAQYASHYQCAMVELELLAQLYEFEGAPQLPEDLQLEILAARGRQFSSPRQCYVTGRTLKFDDYVQAVSNPKGGKSAYHVGHIFPLTRGGRHTSDNVAWLTDDGNRIQGNDTLEEIREKLIEAVIYQLQHNLGDREFSSQFSEKIDLLWKMLSNARQRSIPKRN